MGKGVSEPLRKQSPAWQSVCGTACCHRAGRDCFVRTHYRRGYSDRQCRHGSSSAAACKDIFVHGFIRKNYGISNIKEKQRFCGIFYACGFICTSGGRGVYTKIHFLTYTGAVESLCGILILIVLNTVTELVVRKKIKTMDLC